MRRSPRSLPPDVSYLDLESLMRKTIHLYLIKPSQYDDDGYVVRHWRGVLPSNTLACLAGLTEDAIKQQNLSNFYNIKVHLLDETVDKIPVGKICRSQRWGLAKTIVGLVGVQSNQFPRACDLAHQFRKAGITVMIGGFHVSGYLALLPAIPADIQALLDAGVTVVKGEVEETWPQLLRDAIEGRLQPLYDFLNAKPDLYTKPIPAIAEGDALAIPDALFEHRAVLYTEDRRPFSEVHEVYQRQLLAFPLPHP